LEEAGVEMDKLGRIKVDGIYAAGDVLGPTLASVAMEQ
jgi:pyruvate/2-oxoglutarate dehydrogenase complex dihydrolipoamide dehydrogenase (E3) component